ncbi:MAG: hypothetical protein E7166_03980 [Firmicutes bacterium]|nr:hypothetical protein [Bacillota bacterium]
MSTLFTIFLVGVSLSMDTFSLSLCYGTLNLNNKTTIILSVIVGVFHFLMPLLGITIGNIIIDNLLINGNYLILMIFSIIGIDMIIEAFKEQEKKLLTSFFGILIFAFSVSIDSFSTGIGLKLMTDNILGSLIIFTLTSSTFTYCGIKLGKIINTRLGKISNIIGGIVLIFLGIYFFFK